MRQELRNRTPGRHLDTGHPATLRAPHGPLRVIPVALLMGGLLLCSVAIALAQPVNDDIDNPTSIGTVPFTDSINTLAATTADDDPDCYGRGPTVWYAFTPSVATHLAANTFGSDYSTSLSVYTGTRGSLTQITCWDGGWVTFDAAAGETYYVMVGAAWDGSGGNLVFSVAPPPSNDDFASAADVEGPLPFTEPFTDSINTLAATTAPDDPDCYGRDRTVWYAFTPVKDTRVLADTFGSDYYTSLSVYTGTPDSFTQIACTDSGRVVVDAVAGETYYVMVGAIDYWYSQGNLVFSVSIAPPRLEVALHIEQPVTVDRVGDAELRGTLTCSRPASLEFNGELRQRAGRFVRIEGGFYTGIECDGVTPWTVTIRGNGPYNPGSAQASATATGYDPETGEYLEARVSTPIRLKKAPR